MAIKDRNLSVGTRLVARYKKEAYTAEVVEGDGKLRYRLEDGREFKSPSAAGSAVMGGNACNGWSFWSVEATAENTEQARAEAPHEGTQAQGPKDTDEKQEEPGDGTSVGTEELVPAKKRIFRVPNQQGVPQGETRYFCHDCGKSFMTSSEEPPQVCPEGHPADK